MSLPEIATAFTKKNVLVTGATGFVGLVLVEKLLRTVPNIGTIFLLIRPKQGKVVKERLKDITESSIFDTLINMGRKYALSKLVAVKGNLDIERLALSDANEQRLINEVNYVFHCAATHDFETNLRTTFEVNLLGTRHIVALCKQMKNLHALVHVSSVYAHTDKRNVEEVMYAPPEKVDSIMHLVDNSTDQELKEAKYLKHHYNASTFTKALAEHEVASAMHDFPCCIIRPSMIVSAWKEPVAGWTNSINGPSGIIMNAAMGTMRRYPVAKNLVYDYIPVDVVVNTMIVSAVYTNEHWKESLEFSVWHCTSSTCNPFCWLDVEDKVNEILHKYPLSRTYWYPRLKLLPSMRLFRVSSFIFHFIPAYILDRIIVFNCPNLVRKHTSINQSLKRQEPFIFQEWWFDNKNTLCLQNKINLEDRESFNLNVTSLSWVDFFEDMGHGVRRFLHRDNDSTLFRARVMDKALKVAHWGLECILVGSSVLLIESYLHITRGHAALFVIPPCFFVYNIL